MPRPFNKRYFVSTARVTNVQESPSSITSPAFRAEKSPSNHSLSSSPSSLSSSTSCHRCYPKTRRGILYRVRIRNVSPTRKGFSLNFNGRTSVVVSRAFAERERERELDVFATSKVAVALVCRRREGNFSNSFASPAPSSFFRSPTDRCLPDDINNHLDRQRPTDESNIRSANCTEKSTFAVAKPSLGEKQLVASQQGIKFDSQRLRSRSYPVNPPLDKRFYMARIRARTEYVCTERRR